MGDLAAGSGTQRTSNCADLVLTIRERKKKFFFKVLGGPSLTGGQPFYKWHVSLHTSELS